jgi:hypothetical protein
LNNQDNQISKRREFMPRKSGSNNPAELIKRAIAGIDSQIKELTQQREQLAKMIPGVAGASAPRRGRPRASAAAAKPKRQFSEATKKKLRAAAKARWAKARAEKGE